MQVPKTQKGQMSPSVPSLNRSLTEAASTTANMSQTLLDRLKNVIDRLMPSPGSEVEPTAPSVSHLPALIETANRNLSNCCTALDVIEKIIFG